MTALFSKKSNGLVLLVLGALGLGAAGTIGGLMLYWRTPYGTSQYDQVVQPVQFDHRHHVQDDLIEQRVHRGRGSDSQSERDDRRRDRRRKYWDDPRTGLRAGSERPR